jgi:5-methylthioadenosine/S-adenosylhomocysteine deaminase
MTFVAALRYRSRYLLPSANEGVVEGGCLVVDGGMLTYDGPFMASADSGPFEETIDLGDAVMLPGFVNTHCHSAMSILRGVGNGLSLDDWLRKKVWPLEEQIGEDEMVSGNLLSMVEYARSGITSFIDFYNVRPLLKALSMIRMRCTLSLAFIDLVPAMKEESWKRLGEVSRYRREVEDGKGMRSLALAVHSSYACSEEMLRGVADAASTNGLMVTGHLLEAPTEEALVKATSGVSPATLLRRTGILGPRFLAAHCVHLDRRGVGLLAKAKSSVAHCPRSNSRLGVGVAPVKMMMEGGLNISIGTDGVGSADSVDFFEEMRTAAYLQRSVNRDATLLRPRELLTMATSNGALASGNPRIGRLEKGKMADFIAVKLDRAHLNPGLDMVGNLVFCARPEDVCLTVSGGRVIQAGGELPGVDASSIVERVREIASGLG